MNNITKHLQELSDPKYIEFQIKLNPSVEKEHFLGVRTPILKEYIKELIRDNNYEEFLNELPHYYHDENHLHGLILSNMKDYDKAIKYVSQFVPYMNSWEITDTCLPKAFRKSQNKKDLLKYIKVWIKSKEEYTCRYAIMLLMDCYLEDDYDSSYMKMVSEVKSDKYYINMMIAWYFATAFINHYDEALVYIKEHKLSTWVHNKAIQKAIESFRINDTQKDELRSLKICK